jgi:hypothetical protein
VGPLQREQPTQWHFSPIAQVQFPPLLHFLTSRAFLQTIPGHVAEAARAAEVKTGAT